MKLHVTLGLAALLVVPQVTFAGSPVPPGAIGQVEATVSFCARVDSKSADQYKELGKKVVADMSEKELAEARSADDYKQTFEAITGQLEKVPQEKAVATCRAALRGPGK